MFSRTAVTDDERAAPRPGDEIVPEPDAVMDRRLDLGAPVDEVWPWLVQLGKWRSGWYLTRNVERFLPRKNRAARAVDQRWQGLAVGDVVPDWGGRNETFEVRAIDPGRSIVYWSQRGKTELTWTITLVPDGDRSQVYFRLRLAPIKRTWIANTIGDFLDAWTITWMGDGLRERLSER